MYIGGGGPPNIQLKMYIFKGGGGGTPHPLLFGSLGGDWQPKSKPFYTLRPTVGSLSN